MTYPHKTDPDVKLIIHLFGPSPKTRPEFLQKSDLNCLFFLPRSDWFEQTPDGNKLRTKGRVNQDNTIRYRASKYDCEDCPLKPQCCPNTPSRKVTRSIHEAARDMARNLARTPAYQQSRKDRKKVEMLFAHLKRILKMDRLRLRGPSGAQDEFLLAATAQNLRRMAKWCGHGPPHMALGFVT
jgi:hypothetical protein